MDIVKIHQFWNLYKTISSPAGKADQAVLWEVNENARMFLKASRKPTKKITEYIVYTLLAHPRSLSTSS